MAVQIQKTVPGHLQEQAWLQRRAQRLIRDLSGFQVPGAAALKKAELSILLTDDGHIQMLNRDWRGKNKATDVLSFPQVEGSDLKVLSKAAKESPRSVPGWWLGDVVISVQRAQAQADEHGVSLKDELETLLAHGLLHLLGYDHEKSRADAIKMRRLETRLLGRTMIH